MRDQNTADPAHREPTFLEGILVAFVAALGGTLAHSAVALLFPGGALRLVVAGLGFGYLLYLLGRSRERIGKISTIVLWSLGATLLWALTPTLSLYLLVHLAMIWIVRSLYFHPGLLAAAADLVLIGLGLIGAVGTYLHTGSMFLSLWSFFLVLALFVFIAPSMRTHGREIKTDEDRFARAHRAAEAAVQRLSSTR